MLILFLKETIDIKEHSIYLNKIFIHITLFSDKLSLFNKNFLKVYWNKMLIKALDRQKKKSCSAFSPDGLPKDQTFDIP